ncbi:hypothetical protein [Megasphaera paucivorans]|uniref:hypothetical protein n=1 Tax=Megasphaera paucivorans TaxID=349095 RepID=UPI00115FB8C2|nr:hypothetical protein [Megasphaera paucivorans]
MAIWVATREYNSRPYRGTGVFFILMPADVQKLRQFGWYREDREARPNGQDFSILFQKRV